MLWVWFEYGNVREFLLCKILNCYIILKARDKIISLPLFISIFLSLAMIGSCHIQNVTGLATATFRGSSPLTTYSCMANDNCDNEVHVLGHFESYEYSTQTGRADVYIRISGNSSRPLILVLTSSRSVDWILHTPSGFMINRVIIVSQWILCCIVSY